MCANMTHQKSLEQSVDMPIRRAADPLPVQHIWNAIKTLSVTKQSADVKKIAKLMQKYDEYEEEKAEMYIQQAELDGLIVALPRVSRPSTDVMDNFRVPTEDMPILDGMDWYCFECHLAGNVIPCNACYRVFHPQCIAAGRARYDQVRKVIDFTLANNNNGNQPQRSTNDRSAPASNQNFSSPATNQNFSPATSQNMDTTNCASAAANANYSPILRTPPPTDQNGVYDDRLCSMCNIGNKRTSSADSLTRADLNTLLKFVLSRIRAWLPDMITHTLTKEETQPEWMNEQELAWRANHLFFEHKDMSVIKVNLNNEAYGQLDEFLADVLTIQHNVAVFHGTESEEFAATELMVRDCIHDLTELQLCVDCYRHSNQKVNAKWFCLPCRIPHKLVWAKQKGYPYWPAKVIQDTGSHCDVRFFGGKYERALLSKNFIKPIDTPQSKLQIKVTSAFTKSVEELRYHQKLLQNPDSLHQLVSSPRNSSKSFNSSTASDSNSNDLFNKTTNSTNGRLKRKNNDRHERPASKTKRDSIEMGQCTLENAVKDTSADSVIHISDGEDDFSSFRANFTPHNSFNNGVHDSNNMPVLNEATFNNYQISNPTGNETRHPNETVRNAVENMKTKLSCMTDNNDVVKCAADCMQRELDKVLNDHNDHLKRLFEAHNAQISEMKKKQWCFNCEQEAIYHCCWNTAYCSQSCQQQHWQAEHKVVCRRKR